MREKEKSRERGGEREREKERERERERERRGSEKIHLAKYFKKKCVFAPEEHHAGLIILLRYTTTKK